MKRTIFTAGMFAGLAGMTLAAYTMKKTMPGTEMKVTPEMVAPIMAKATRPQGAWRLPLKNVELSLPRDANQLMPISTAKYATIVIITIVGVIY